MRLAGCDTTQAPAPAGDTPCEFFVCFDCGVVGDIDESRGNEHFPGSYCESCWDRMCSEDPIRTESYDCPDYMEAE